MIAAGIQRCSVISTSEFFVLYRKDMATTLRLPGLQASSFFIAGKPSCLQGISILSETTPVGWNSGNMQPAAARAIRTDVVFDGTTISSGILNSGNEITIFSFLLKSTAGCCPNFEANVDFSLCRCWCSTVRLRLSEVTTPTTSSTAKQSFRNRRGRRFFILSFCVLSSIFHCRLKKGLPSRSLARVT
jgi:hypothetical protein